MSLGSKLIGDISIQAVRDYSKMAGRLVCPESFIRDVSAQAYNAITSDRVCIELPFRVLLNEWGVDRKSLEGLGYFRVDMAAFKNERQTPSDLDCLFEFKLWTDRFKVARDVRRLKKIIAATKELSQYQNTHIGGYVIVCPQYCQGISNLRGAMKDFYERFPVSYSIIEECICGNGKPYGIGAAVIDVHDCIEGHFG